MDTMILIPYDRYQSRPEKTIESERNQTAKETGTTRNTEQGPSNVDNDMTFY